MISEDDLAQLARTRLPVPKEGPWPAAERPERRHYAPADKAHLPARMNVKLVGLSFVETYPANIDALEDQGPGAVVVLRREPDNERDPNAVQVVHVTDDGEAVMLGHVPAGLAGRLAPEMDAGADWKIAEARVLRTTGAYSDRPGLAVDIERRGE